MKRFLRRQLKSVSKRGKEFLRHGVGLPAGAAAGVATILGLSSPPEGTERLDVLFQGLGEGSITVGAFLAGIGAWLAVWLVVEKGGKGFTVEDEE